MAIKTQIRSFVVGLAAVSLVAGCVSTGSDRTNEVESTAGNAHAGLEKSKAAINATLASLNTLQLEGSVLADVYPAFKEHVATVSAGAERVKDNAVAMEEAGTAKFDAWKSELDLIANEQIKKTSLKSMAEAVKKHGELLTLLKESKTVMDPFVSDLNDIVTYLDLDLSKEGIKKISGFNGPIKKAVKSGERVNKWIDDVVGELMKSEGASASK